MQANRWILLTCLGTLGEILPIRRLALNLVGQGHRVHVCGPSYCRGLFDAHVMSYSVLPSGTEQQVPTTSDLARIFTRRSEYVAEDIDRFCHQAVQHIREEIVTRRIEEVMYSWITPAGALAAHLCGVPYERVFLYPAALNQMADPPVIARWRRLTAAGSSLGTRQRARELVRRHYLRMVPRLRDLGDSIGILPHLYDLRHDGPSETTGLCLFDSRLLLAPESGLTFAKLLSAAVPPAMPPELAEFLATHDAPIVVSLGSVTGAAKEAAISRITKAARALSVPVILLLGMQGPRRVIRRPGMLVLSEYPLSAAAPVARIVVHHAGIGSLQETLAAGRPSLAMPLLYDQFDNARRLEALGLSNVITSPDMPDSAVTALLTSTLDDEGMRRRCEAWRDHGHAPQPAPLSSRC